MQQMEYREVQCHHLRVLQLHKRIAGLRIGYLLDPEGGIDEPLTVGLSGLGRSFSDDPAALKTTTGGVVDGGKSEKLYCEPGTINTGGPVKGSAVPAANSELP